MQDISPLEMHHCAASFTVAADPDANIFHGMRADDKATLRANIIDLILGMDAPQAVLLTCGSEVELPDCSIKTIAYHGGLVRGVLISSISSKPYMSQHPPV